MSFASKRCIFNDVVRLEKVYFQRCRSPQKGVFSTIPFASKRCILNYVVHLEILKDKLEFNKGMIVENLVAQLLAASGHPLYFFSETSASDSADRMEIDFLIQKPEVTSRHNICPIEVKSTTRYALSSLNKFRGKYRKYLSTPYVLHSGNYKEKDGIIYLPLYMTGLL